MMRNRSHDTPCVYLHLAFEAAWQRTKVLLPKSVRRCTNAFRMKPDGIDGLDVVIVGYSMTFLELRIQELRIPVRAENVLAKAKEGLVSSS